MDPFQEKYGNTIAAVLFLPSLLADVFWVACILGATVSVVLDISRYLSISISAVVAIVYTMLGGLYSVAYTDVIQLIFMFFGLAIGGICYQAFYQRVLSAASDAQAKLTCFAGAALCPILGIPSILVGAVAASTDWNQTSFGLPSPYERDMAGLILPIALQQLCPFAVSLVGMGALAAAVMSSVDSVLLSAASQFARNIYKNIIYKKASERSIVVVIRVSIVLCGLVGALLATTSSSVSLFWIVSADVLYSILTPQIICTLFLPRWVNHYGACAGFVFGLVLRMAAGEPTLGLSAVLPLPWDKILQNGQRHHVIPFRTVIVLISFTSILLVSQLTTWLSNRGFLSEISEGNSELDEIKRIQTNETINESLTASL
uniref:Uncharacterized protein n=1 Tax=Knipowitschia caucasica TaxID=637954 RepID=A0AAV2IU67_KNICA